MPRYLRWIAAASTGLTAWFLFVVAFGAVAIGRRSGADVNLGVGAGLIASFGSFIVPMITGLAVSDWLAARYPKHVPSSVDMGAGQRDLPGREDL